MFVLDKVVPALHTQSGYLHSGRPASDLVPSSCCDVNELVVVVMVGVRAVPLHPFLPRRPVSLNVRASDVRKDTFKVTRVYSSAN